MQVTYNPFTQSLLYHWQLCLSWNATFVKICKFTLNPFFNIDFRQPACRFKLQRGAGARIGRAGAGGGDGARKEVSRRDVDKGAR